MTADALTNHQLFSNRDWKANSIVEIGFLDSSCIKVNAKRNKYLGEWAADKLNKSDNDKKTYIQEVIKSGFAEPGDEDVFRKIQGDFKKASISIPDSKIREQMTSLLERAQKELL